MELLKKANGNIPRTEEEKLKMIEEMSIHYAKFLLAAGFDYLADPHTIDTPKRVSKAWINDLITGNISEMCSVSAFPNDEGYTGLVIQTDIDVVSMCAHHNLPFKGTAYVSYIPGKSSTDMILGLSKLNKIVDFFSRRLNVQESLTKQVHDKVDELCVGNRGVAVVIMSQHSCVSCRGTKQDSTMKTSQLSGYFFDNEATRNELFQLIGQSHK